jgi:hypothetical protein
MQKQIYLKIVYVAAIIHNKNNSIIMLGYFLVIELKDIIKNRKGYTKIY